MMKQILAGLSLLGTAAVAHAVPIEGLWTNPKHSVIVRIAPCGAAYCGTVTWASAKAKQRTGDELIGMQLMSGFRPDGDGGYKGHVFEPRHDLSGSATIRMTGSDAMIVRGCAFAGILCKEQRWTRVS